MVLLVMMMVVVVGVLSVEHLSDTPRSLVQGPTLAADGARCLAVF